MIAAIRDKEELEKVYAELLDRFGPLPDEAASLLALNKTAKNILKMPDRIELPDTAFLNKMPFCRKIIITRF